MTTPVLALVAILLVAIGWWWLRRRTGTTAKGRDAPEDALDTIAAWPPEATRVLTTPEQRAFQLLVRNLPPGYPVLAQVPLSRFLRVPTRHSYREWMRRVGRLNADLLVCDSTFQALAAISIRPSQGKDSERGLERHKRMDRVLRKAGLRVLNWREDALPQADMVPELVFGRATLAEMAEASAVSPTEAPQEQSVEAEALATPDERLADPLPSTFFDDLDTRPVPMPRPKPRE